MTIRSGYSKRAKPCSRAYPVDMMIAAMEPISTTTFMKRANGSSTKASLKVEPRRRGEDQDQRDDRKHRDRERRHDAGRPLAGERADQHQHEGADRQDDLRQRREEVGERRHGVTAASFPAADSAAW